MRLLLCGDDEPGLRALARALAPDAVEVLVAATGPAFALETTEEDGVVLHRARRADLHPRHWQKSASVDVRAALRELLARGGFDLVHVLAWRGLTRDLVATAARAGVPAVASLADDWATCLLEVRVRPEDGAACDVVAGAGACTRCARGVEPRTTWVPAEAEFLAFAERAAAVRTELALAALVLAPSAEHVERLRTHGAPLGDREVRVAAAGDTDALRAAYAAALARGAPDVDGAAPAWYEERMQRFAEDAWDRGCREAAP